MERESFEDEEVAAILNNNFVSIKIDKEERSDIDHFFMESCIAFNGHGGWPLSAFISHDKLPFFTGTYYPKQTFITLLEKIINLWRTDRESLYKTGNSIKNYLEKSAAESDDHLIRTDKIEKLAAEQLENAFDSHYGGFGTAPKFPTVHNLLFLVHYGILYPESKAMAMVDKTLTSMAAGGIHDHIGGGFCRYSTDKKWLIPHFEKMLYDNAMFLMIYSLAAVLIDKKYSSVAERIVEYCEREMLSPKGGFYTAEDADSEGEEGKFYLFTKEDIYAALTKSEAEEYCRDYDITDNGNFDGKNIPNRIGREFIPDDPRAKKLLQYRSKRIPPFKDDKILSSSNGLMIAALALAGRYWEQKEWITLAKNAAEFVLKNLFVKGRLMSSWREDKAANPATLDDYGYLLWGISEIYFSTFNPRWLSESIKIADEIIRLFEDANGGGLYLSGTDVADLPMRQKYFRDSAVPSGNSIVAYSFYRLSSITHNKKYADIADDIILAGYREAGGYTTANIGIILADMFKRNQINVTLSAASDIAEMLSVINLNNPFITTCICGRGFEPVDNMIRNIQHSQNNKTTAYICDNKGCRPPLTEPEKVKNLLDRLLQ